MPLAELLPRFSPAADWGEELSGDLGGELMGVLAMLCFGVVLGPLALAMGQRARMALVGEARHEGVGAAHAAITLGKLALVLHLTLLATIVPWLLFVMPLVRNDGDRRDGEDQGRAARHRAMLPATRSSRPASTSR